MVGGFGATKLSVIAGAPIVYVRDAVNTWEPTVAVAVTLSAEPACACAVAKSLIDNRIVATPETLVSAVPDAGVRVAKAPPVKVTMVFASGFPVRSNTVARAVNGPDVVRELLLTLFASNKLSVTPAMAAAPTEMVLFSVNVVVPTVAVAVTVSAVLASATSLSVSVTVA